MTDFGEPTPAEEIWIWDKHKSSPVWRHFKTNLRNPNIVMCCHCGNEYPCHGPTTSLKYHLEKVHKIPITPSQKFRNRSSIKAIKVDSSSQVDDVSNVEDTK